MTIFQTLVIINLTGVVTILVCIAYELSEIKDFLKNKK